MKNEQYNKNLISAIKNALPKNERISHVLAELLPIGKDAIYRRLREEVPFTFEEVSKISQHLNISLDNIIGIKNTNRAAFDLNFHPSADLLNNYSKSMQSYIQLFQKMRKGPESKIRLAFNTLPYLSYMSFKDISRFRLYRLMYQTMGNAAPSSFSELTLPPEIVDIQKKLFMESRHVPFTQLILDKNAFSSFVSDISYFYKLNLISQTEVENLKEELRMLIEDWELLAKTGKYNTGNEMLIYISDINFETCYIHYESPNMELCSLRIYSINTITSRDPDLCLLHKEWIESLKNYSTLITQSGEMQRIDFFRKQREIVANI